MTKTNINRINEIAAQITACSKDAYHREEVLPELLDLQKQLINLVFNDTHAEIGRLRIWDVERHLEQMNVDCGHVADDLLARVLMNCKNICNLIKSEFSGNAGERKAFWSIDTIRCKKTVLKNVEFRNGEHRTELDGIVITDKAIFVIEVKNPSRDIYIDERGNYCRIGTTMTFDKNIGEKMNEKVSLLRDALAGSGIENFNIENIVVFTNNNIRVDNRYPHINTCFLSDMPHIIEKYSGDVSYSDEDILRMVASVSEAKCHEAYPLPIDMQQFKSDFATLLATLERATSGVIEETTDKSAAEDVSICTTTANDPTTKTCAAPVQRSNKKTVVKKIILGIGTALTAIGVVGAMMCKAAKN